MTTETSLHLDIPLDEIRYLDVLAESQWRDVSRRLRAAYEIHRLYAGAPGGVTHGRLLRLTAGNPDADVRVAIDCVPSVVSRPLLAAARAAVRVCAAQTADRRLLLERVALLFHIVDVHDAVPATDALPSVHGLGAAVSLGQSPGHPTIWSLLEASLGAFAPTVALDVRDAGGALRESSLVMLVHAPGQPMSATLDWGTSNPGWFEASALSAELRARGVRVHEAHAPERRRAGLARTAGGFLSRGGVWPPDSTAAAAAAQGALGISAIATGMVQSDRAAAMATAIAATIMQAVRAFPGEAA